MWEEIREIAQRENVGMLAVSDRGHAAGDEQVRHARSRRVVDCQSGR